MATRNDIDSTEKLLNLIRKGAPREIVNNRVSQAPAAGFWKGLKGRMLPFRTRRVIGLELLRDNLHITLSEQSKSGWTIIKASSINLPAEMNLDTPEFQVFLQNHLQNIDPEKTSEVWVTLPASKGEILNIRVPRVKKGISNVVYWSARKEKNFDTQEYYFDYRIRGEVDEGGTKKIQAEVSLAQAEEINKYKKIIGDIGYRLEGVTLPAFSLDNLFQDSRDELRDKSYAILCIGEDNSCINFYRDGTVLMSRVLRTGEDSFLDSISMESSREEQDSLESPALEGSADDMLQEESPRDREKARQILKEMQQKSAEKSDAGEPESETSPLDMVYPALERLIRQIDRTIDHSVKVLGNPAPETIYICGKISYLHGIAGFFSKNLDMPAEILDVLTPSRPHASNEVARLDPEQHLSLVSAAGLAIPWSGTVNFLHTAMDKEREAAALRNTNLVAAGCALAFVVVSGYWAWTGHQLEQAREETQALQDRLSDFSPRLTQEMLQQLLAEHQEFKQKIADRARRLQVAALIGEIGRITPDDFRLLEMILELGSPSNQDDTTKNIIVEGFIRGESNTFETRMTRYLINLRRSPMFRDANIQRSNRGTLEQEGEVYRFVLNIEPEQV